MLLKDRITELNQHRLTPFLETGFKRSYFDALVDALNISEEAAWPDAFGKALRSWIEKNRCPKVQTLSLFTGAGGLDIGFHDAGFNIALMVEIDPNFVQTLQANKSSKHYFKNSQILCEDIGDLKPLKNLNVDLVIGGPPCQAFSAAGRRVAGAPGFMDSRGKLYKEFISILETIRPKAFLFENVYGLTGVQNGEVWRAVLSDFESLGYKFSHRILDAAGYGVPQHRERLIVVGTRGPRFLFPKPTHGPDSPDQRPYYTPKEAFLNLGEEEKPDLVGGKWGYLLHDIPPGLNYSFYTAKMGHPQPIFAWRSKFSDFLYKANPFMPVRSIKASGGQYTGPFHWENRPFSVAELKRLQTIPDDYLINGSRQSAVKQIGNAVPSQLARILALSLLSQIWKIKLPAELEFLTQSDQLSFRRRKRYMTTVYRKKAARALARIKNLRLAENQASGKNSHRYWAKIDMQNFNWLLDPEEDPRFLVRVDSSGRLLSIHVQTYENAHSNATTASGCMIRVFPSRLGWHIPYKNIELVGHPLNSEVFVSLWKALQLYLAEANLKADLVQLSGYYQYMPRLEAEMTFSEEKAPFPLWIIVKKVVEGIAVRQTLPLETMARLWEVPIALACRGLKNLRLLGYEVRGHSTNVRMPKNHYLIPYCFPTLNPRSVQLRKKLEVKIP